MYAKLNRIAIRFALGLAALGGVSVVNAGYAWPADPAGFSRSGPWGAGPGYAAGANDSTFGRVIHQQNGLKLQVAGRAVTMPVAYRFAQNAPRYAAKALFLHPGVRTAIGLAAWLGVAEIFWDSATSTWKQLKTDTAPPDYHYLVDYVPDPGLSSTPEGACSNFAAVWGAQGLAIISSEVSNGRCLVRYKNKANMNDSVNRGINRIDKPCPVGYERTPAGCIRRSERVLSPEQFEEELFKRSMPQTVPRELPPNTPLPVEPNPKINPEPGQDPQHRPMFVPTGDPVPNPNYDPNAAPGPNNQPWIQPGVRLNPSPTVNDPWRIDVQPVDRPKEDGNPLLGPEPETNPDTGKDDKPKPEERPGLCDEYPDILACQKPELDTPDDEIPKTTKDVSYTPDNLFGGGSCPANKTMNIAGQQMTVWDWDASCGYIQTYMRPVILVLCAFAAFVIVSGGTRQ